MNVVLTSEHRFTRTPDGVVWTEGINSYEFWTRYVEVFDQVTVTARVRDTAEPLPGWRRASGPDVAFAPLPDYLGPWQYLVRAFAVRRALKQPAGAADAVILRVSSQIAGCLQPRLAGRPYGVEVVNDPYDVFSPGAVRHPLRPFLRCWFTRQMRRQCRNAAGAAYVTDRVLQQRYPCEAYSSGISDVEMSPEAILPFPRAVPDSRVARQRFRLVTVASLAQMYKAPDILLRAVAECVRSGLDLALCVIGDGKHRAELERLASRLGLEQRVSFLGQLPAGTAVREQLDRSDLFALPSRCEGLPRAMIEAMARSLPCIGSAVGGIPELLAPEDLVPPGEAASLAAKIREVLGSPERMRAMSVRNLAIARRYADECLAEKRRAFLEHIRNCTADWLARRAPGASAALARSARPVIGSQS